MMGVRGVAVTRFELCNRQAIGDLLDALDAVGVTKTELARRMGRDFSTVQEWFVGGRKNLPLAILYALTAPEAEAFLRYYMQSVGVAQAHAKTA